MKVTKYQLKNGNIRYRIKGYIGTDRLTGKKHFLDKSGFKSKKEARLCGNKAIVSFNKGEYKTKQERMTFEEVFKLWLEVYKTKVKDSTYQMETDAMRRHILPIFGDKYVDKISTSFCQKQVIKWSEYYKKFNNLKSKTSMVLEFARLNLKIINENPMKDVELPKNNFDSYEAPYYDAAQLKYFLSCVQDYGDEQIYVLFHLIAYSGMREGEALALTWEDFNINSGSIYINKSISRGINYKSYVSTPKTSSSCREIHLDPKTIGLLKKWRETQQEKTLQFQDTVNKKMQFIFTNENNEHFYSGFVGKKLQSLSKIYDFDKITVHGLRHTHCTLLLEAGVSLKAVQDRLGHSSMEMVMNIYSHVNKKEKILTGNKLAKYIESYN